MPDYYIGLISGTSIDGIDAVLAEFGDRSVSIAASATHPYPSELSEQLVAATRQPESCTPDVIGMLDQWVGECFRDAALSLIEEAKGGQVIAIGSHGQTLRHRPDVERPFTMQIGDPNLIAKGTGLTCIADFRRADMALGGQGAPLVPPFHEWLFRDPAIDRCALNIGGIANVTVLPAGPDPISGFDTGPGNTLLDAWTRRHRNAAYDDAGAWAASGNSDVRLLSRMMEDRYFKKPPPKSTGFEYFNDAWLDSHVDDSMNPDDVQATLCDLTVFTVARAVEAHASNTRELFVCGGGVHNATLMSGIAGSLGSVKVASTADFGLDPDRVEACAFAWLAKRALEGKPGNAPGVTGASAATILGAIHPGT